MKDMNYLSYWIRRFFLEYLISQKNLSKNTQQSYRDTFQLMLSFLARNIKKHIEELLIDDIHADLIKAFLLDLESVRHCSSSTRNQRLAAIHTFAEFLAINNPIFVEWSRQIKLIPFKKSKPTAITYLEKSEMDALLNAPEKNTKQGIRDYTLLIFLYNTGARADEAAQLKIADLHIAHSKKGDLSTVTITGKGNKVRRCPLWQQTADMLSTLILNRDPCQHVFLNRCKQPITRFGIHTLVK